MESSYCLRIALFTCAALGACHHSSREVSLGPQSGGFYTYEGIANGQALKGYFVVADSSASLQPDGDRCWTFDTERNRREVPRVVRFYCDGAVNESTPTSGGSTMILVSLRNPERESQWGRRIKVPQNKQVCTVEGRDSNGRAKCLHFETQRQWTERWTYGRLKVRRGSGLAR